MPNEKRKPLSYAEWSALHRGYEAWIEDVIQPMRDDRKDLLELLGVPADYRDKPNGRAVSSQWEHTARILAAREQAGNPYVRAADMPDPGPDESDATHLFVSRLASVR